MKIFLAAAAVLAATFTQAADAEPQKDVVPQNYYGKVAQRLASMLPAKHVLQRSLDDEISQRAWTNLVTYYDFDRSVFLKDDLVRLSAHEKTIDDELKAGVMEIQRGTRSSVWKDAEADSATVFPFTSFLEKLVTFQ